MRKGEISVESILAIAAGAIVLLGLIQLSNSSLLPSMNSTVTQLLNEELTVGSSNDQPDANTNSDGGSANSDSNESETSGSTSGSNQESNSEGNNGQVDPAGEGFAKDLFVAYAKDKAAELVELAKEKAKQEIKDNWPNGPTGFELDLGDLDEAIDAEVRGGVTNGISTVFDVIGAVDGLTQADREVKRLAAEGKYEEAFGKIFSGSSRFIVDTVMSAPGVEKVLKKLPPKVQLAVTAAIPNAIESAAQSLGEKAFGSIGKKINDRLWTWYDKGYLPRKPRIPRDYNFGKTR